MSEDAWETLCRLVDEAGAVMTFDARRHSRAGRGWPDCLPPMFPELELQVEHWEPSDRLPYYHLHPTRGLIVNQPKKVELWSRPRRRPT